MPIIIIVIIIIIAIMITINDHADNNSPDHNDHHKLDHHKHVQHESLQAILFMVDMMAAMLLWVCCRRLLLERGANVNAVNSGRVMWQC